MPFTYLAKIVKCKFYFENLQKRMVRHLLSMHLMPTLLSEYFGSKNKKIQSIASRFILKVFSTT